MNIYTDQYVNWAVAAAVAFRCPRNVRLLLDDDTQVPLRCRWMGFTRDGHEAWAARPADGKPVQRSRVVGVEVEAWEGTCLDIQNVPDGFVCPDCSKVSNDPRDLREGYCGACHKVTGRPL